MTRTALSLLLVVTLAVPSAVTLADAQTSTPPAPSPLMTPPPPRTSPAPVPAPPPPAPVLETPQPPGEQPTVIETSRVPYQAFEVTDAHRIGAAALNVIYVPGKAITCAAGVGLAAGMMLATFGSQYPWAVRFFEEGCGYPWYLRPRHVAGEDPRDER
jgi:hypothetical protein